MVDPYQLLHLTLRCHAARDPRRLASNPKSPARDLFHDDTIIRCKRKEMKGRYKFVQTV